MKSPNTEPTSGKFENIIYFQYITETKTTIYYDRA